MIFKTMTASVLLCLAACGGGGDIADRATKASEAACACKDFDCTKAQIASLNKMSIKEKDAVAKLSAERAEVYKSAVSKAGDCQQALRK